MTSACKVGASVVEAGLVAAAELITDYILTVTVSVASGLDAVWSAIAPVSRTPERFRRKTTARK